jgi:single-strand DNA-binding protein
MPGLPTISGTFTVVRDPELRFTAGGQAVASLTVVANDRRKNQTTNEWENGDRTPFLKVTLWANDAEALAESGVTKGDRVVVTGQLYEREYEKSDTTKGVSIEIKFASVGVVPKIARTAREGGSSRPVDNDPWASSTTDAPPF